MPLRFSQLPIVWGAIGVHVPCVVPEPSGRERPASHFETRRQLRCDDETFSELWRIRMSSCQRARSQHRDEASHSSCRRQVLERVTADNLSEREDFLISQLETLRCRIRRETGDEISRAGITGRIQNEQQHDQKQGTELHENVETQVAGVLELAPIPVRNAGGADHEEWTEEPSADRETDTLGE